TVTVDPYSVTEPSVEINLADAISDADGDTLTLSSISDVALPATLSQNGLVLTYTPNGVEGTTSLHYSVTDGMDTSSSVVSIISASQGKLTANDFAVPAMAMDAQTITIDVASFVSNESGRDLVLSGVVGAKLGSVNLITDTTQFTYTPNNISFGDEILTYAVTDNEGHYAYADIAISLEASVKPSITDLTLTEELGVMTATVTCNDCDLARTDYQYDIDGVPVGENSAHYTLVGDEKEHNIGVTVTAKNAYCTVNNTGVSGGNACKTTMAKVIVTAGIVKNISAYEHNGIGQQFSLIKNDQTVVSWGMNNDTSSVDHLLTNVVSITSNLRGGAALKSDGSVVAWGSQSTGGDTSAVDDELYNIESIVANYDAFAALRGDGKVVTWGHSNAGVGDYSKTLANIQRIFGGYVRFVAIEDDGTVIEWGGTNCFAAPLGECIELDEVQAEFNNVADVVLNQSAAAAVNADGTVTTWGRKTSGGDSSAVKMALTDIVSVTAANNSFTALKTDGSLVVWGDIDTSGLSLSAEGIVELPANHYFSSVVANLNAYAGVLDNGQVISWGSKSDGGDHVNDIGVLYARSITAGGDGFVALHDDGTVTGWGGNRSGASNISASLAAKLVEVEHVVGNNFDFTALKSDGTIESWGGMPFFYQMPADKLSELYLLVEVYKELNWRQ
ncbi:Ig-like domain-containing protein, partial [Shewanella sp. 10N.261.52.F9]|uniref:Ig-like domain-containing protein n=1 Tax=Shewanella sp. 10N.261.52.F9 TaxID=3229684 RepID=UPI00354F38B7